MVSHRHDRAVMNRSMIGDLFVRTICLANHSAFLCYGCKFKFLTVSKSLNQLPSSVKKL